MQAFSLLQKERGMQHRNKHNYSPFMHKVQFLSGKKSGGNSQKLQINYKSTKQLK